MQLIISIAC